MRISRTGAGGSAMPSPLYTQPQESSEGLELPLKSLTEGFEVTLAEFGILWELLWVGQRHEDDPPSEGPTAAPMRTEPVLGSGVLEGECRYRPSYGRGDVGNPWR